MDIFVRADFNYCDLFHNGKVYEILLNLAPGVKWNMGKGWQAATLGIDHKGTDRISGKDNRLHRRDTQGYLTTERYASQTAAMYPRQQL